MRNVKKILAILLLLVMTVCAAVGCGLFDSGNSSEPESSSSPEAPSVPEELLGEYYSASGATENTLTLEGDWSFDFRYNDVVSSGEYSVKGTTITLKFENASTATGVLTENAVELQYNNSVLTLLKKINFSVTFDAKGGSAVQAQSVVNGKTATLPAAPTYDGYKLVGWYTDEACTTAFDFSQAITSDTRLYALWSKMEYSTEFTVSFNLGYEGAASLEAVETVGNKLFSLPEPERNGYVFKGWYVSQYDDAEKLSYVFKAGVTVVGEHTTLYALWQDEKAVLSMPVINVSGSDVSWERVEGATTYKVVIKTPTGTDIERDTMNPLVPSVITAGGDYVITVTATKGGNSSSATVYYRVNPLARVTGFAVEGRVLSFDAVPNAQKYLVTAICADSAHIVESVEITEAQYDFSDCAMGRNGIKFSVVAIADGYAKSFASEYTYVDEGYVATTITLNKGEYGTLTNATYTVAHGYDYVLPVPNVDAAAEYQFAGWFADAECQIRLTDCTGRGIAAWDSANGKQVYAKWINEIFAYNLITVNNAQAYEVAAGANFNELTHVTVPSVYEGVPVARIQSEGFKDSASIKTLELPDTIVEIGAGAFAGCTALTSINIYDAGNTSDVYTSIDGIVFSMTRQTRALSLAKMPTGRQGAYVVPDNVVAILDRAFEGSQISDVTISASVRTIGAEAFADSALASISFMAGDTALTISDRAFANTKLTEITLPARLTDIALKRLAVVTYTSGYSTYTEPVADKSQATDVFFGCTELASITVESGNTVYKAVDNVLFSKDGKTLLYALSVVDGEYVIPANTQTIGVGAFYSTSITKVTIPNSVIEIGDGAFFASTTLETVDFSKEASLDGITIGKYAFGTLSTIKNALKEFNMNDNTKIERIDDYAFHYSLNLTEIKISQFTTYIGEKAFAFCRGVTVIDFSLGDEYGGGALTVGSQAFRNINVTTVKLGSHITAESALAFADSFEMLEAFTVSEDSEALTAVDGILYSKVDGKIHSLIAIPTAKVLTRYVIPDGVVEIPASAFENNRNLTSVTIPASVTKIGTKAFYAGTSFSAKLTSVTFAGTPASGTSLVIGDMAFYGQANITSMQLPAHTDTIGVSAFVGTKITALSIPSATTVIGDAAFAGISTLTTVTIGENSKLTSIGERAFAGCSITSITIPASVTTIKPFAFSGTINSFEEVLHREWDENGDAVDTYEFEVSISANGLKSIAFEANSQLTEIPAYAFAGATFTSIEIPNSVTHIAANAFYNMNTLKTVTFEEGGSEPLTLGGAETLTMLTGNDYTALLTSSIENSGAVFVNSITTLALPARIADLGDELDFLNNLSELIIPENDRYVVIDSILYNAEKTEMVYIPAKLAGSITIPSTVTSIPLDVFQNNTALVAINMEASNDAYSSMDGILYNADKTEILLIPAKLAGSITIPATVTNIPLDVFESNTSITAINVEEGNEAYASVDGILYNADKTEMVLIPAKLAGSITIPATVTSIPLDVFRSNTSITAINVEEGNEAYASVDGILYNAEKTEILLITAAYANTTIQIPTGITTISSQLFSGNTTITSITFAEGSLLTEISANAFKGNTTITSISLPASLKTIGGGAFEGSRLATVLFAEGTELDSIGEKAFYNTAITSITVPSCATVGDQAFGGNTALKNVTFSEGLVTLGEQTFAGCTVLESVAFPASLETMGDYTFVSKTTTSGGGWGGGWGGGSSSTTTYVGISTLTSVTFAEGSKLTTIPQGTFYDAGLASFEIPASVTAIGDDAFYGAALTSITVPASVTALGVSVFENCASLESATINAAIDTLPERAFYGCTRLTSLTLSDGITSLGSSSLQGASLTSFTVPAGMTELNVTAFTNVPKFEVSEANEVYSASNGILMSKDGTKVILCYSGYEGALEIAEGVTTIGESAFEEQTGITSIKLPSTLTTIETYAFSGCSSVLTITLPAALTTIGEYAFNNWDGLFEVVNNSALEITVGCEAGWSETCSVGKLDAYAKVVSVGESKLITDGDWIYVNTSNDYAEGKFVVKYVGSATEIVLDNDIVGILDGAFSELGLTSITLNEGLVYIGAEAFGWSNNLTELTLPSTVKYLGTRFITGNKSITSLIIPESVDMIAANAFSGLNTLTLYFKAGEAVAESFASNWDGGVTTKLFGWTGEEVTYTFNTDGANETVEPIVSNGIITIPDTLTKDGYHFAGWYTAADFSGEAVSGSYYSTSITSFYAKWISEEEWAASMSGDTFATSIDMTLGNAYAHEYTAVATGLANSYRPGKEGYRFFKFTATAAGAYKISSEFAIAGGQPYYVPLDETGGQSAGSSNLVNPYTVTLEAGQTVYVAICLNSYSIGLSGTITITINAA